MTTSEGAVTMIWFYTLSQQKLEIITHSFNFWRQTFFFESVHSFICSEHKDAAPLRHNIRYSLKSAAEGHKLIAVKSKVGRIQKIIIFFEKFVQELSVSSTFSQTFPLLIPPLRTHIYKYIRIP